MSLYWISLYWFGGVSCFIPSILLWILYLLFSKTCAALMFVGLGGGVEGCDKVLCLLGSRNTALFCGRFWHLEEILHNRGSVGEVQHAWRPLLSVHLEWPGFFRRLLMASFCNARFKGLLRCHSQLVARRKIIVVNGTSRGWHLI